MSSTRVSPVRLGSRVASPAGARPPKETLNPDSPFSRQDIGSRSSTFARPALYLAPCPEGSQVAPSLVSAQSLFTGARARPSFARHAALPSVDSEQVDPQPELASVRLLPDDPRRTPGRYDSVSRHWYVRVCSWVKGSSSHISPSGSAHVVLLLSCRLGRPFPLQGPHQLWPMDGQRPQGLAA